MISALYLHIPFCRKICSYCDFPKVLHLQKWEDEYIPLLVKEIYSYHIPIDSLETIYIGGGTPSLLSKKNLEILLGFLHHSFPSTKEFTREANPESLTIEKIRIRKQNGVNRISLGVESTSSSLLAFLGREHKVNEVENVLKELTEEGIKNINLDFIYGIPGESMGQLRNDIDFAVSQNIQHVSFYSLQLEPGTRLTARKTQPVSDELYREQYDFLCEELSRHGFFRYEISNFAKKGYQSLHNLTYWHDRQYYACGVGAAGYIGNRRYLNTKSLTDYFKGIRIVKKDRISPEDREREYLRLHLRLVEGFPLEEYKIIFQRDFLSSFSTKIAENKEYFEVKNGFFRIKPEYLYVRDTLLLSLF